MTRDKKTAAVQVLLPIPVFGPFDYRVPAGMALERGDFVEAPLGQRTVTGIVWGCEAPRVDKAKLKDVHLLHDHPPLPAAVPDFIDWLANYTLSPRESVLRMALRGFRPGPPKTRNFYRRGRSEPARPAQIRLTPARKRVLELLANGLARTASEIAELAGVSQGVVKGLLASGCLIAEERPVEPPVDAPDPDLPSKPLNPKQAEAADVLIQAVRKGEYSPFLLDGVTGSGKTEVYFEALSAALKAGKQILVLVPEIALTLQLATRFEERFGGTAALWHSDLGQAARRQIWRGVLDGKVKAVIGARSALFLPFENLGLIIVDEEHDPSFKQEEGVRYHARDMALVRARLSGIPAILASATPSLETHLNGLRGRFKILTLPDRAGQAALPAIRAVDLRSFPPEKQSWISPPLRDAMVETLSQGEQVLLYLNRRGYAPLTLCRACGHRFACPHCDAWLVEHQFRNTLECHHCGYRRRLPDSCPECKTAGQLAPCGPGVERLQEEASHQFPEARIAVLSSDLTESAQALQNLINRVEERRIDILIGTQLVAKGHHFPNLTLVGVIDGDLGLSGGDLRASERTFQLLSQVSGRAGRAEKPGQVYIQTAMPDHPVMQALIAGDRDGFVAEELRQREAFGQPPFGHLAALILSSRDEAGLRAYAAELAAAAPKSVKVRLLGPAPAPLFVLRGRRRMRFLLHSARAKDVQHFLRDWLPRLKPPGHIRRAVDIDPYSFM